MAAVPYAHIVTNMLRNKHPKGTDISLTPNPKDIVGLLLLSPFLVDSLYFVDLGKYG